MMLSDVWYLSVAYFGAKSRTKRPRKTIIGTEVAHVTRTPLSRSKGQRSPGRFTHHDVNASGSCSDERGNVFMVGTHCGRLGGARRFGAHRGRRGAGHIVAAPAQLVLLTTFTVHIQLHSELQWREKYLECLMVLQILRSDNPSIDVVIYKFVTTVTRRLNFLIWTLCMYRCTLYAVQYNRQFLKFRHFKYIIHWF